MKNLLTWKFRSDAGVVGSVRVLVLENGSLALEARFAVPAELVDELGCSPPPYAQVRGVTVAEWFYRRENLPELLDILTMLMEEVAPADCYAPSIERFSGDVPEESSPSS